MRPFALLLLACSLLFSLPPHEAHAQPEEWQATIGLTVDARDLPRNLLTSHMTIHAKDGIAALAFPLWIPGNHAPSGPIQNIAGIEVYDENENPIEWTRSVEFPERLLLDGPTDRTKVIVKLRYIASQPSVISGSSDSYGRPNFGAINWNTVVLYPIGPEGDEYTQLNTAVTPAINQAGTVNLGPVGSGDSENELVNPGLRTPEKSSTHWMTSPATSLTEDKRKLGSFLISSSMNTSEMFRRENPVWEYETVSLAELIDSPVILGEHLNTIELAPVNGAPHLFHVVASEPRFTKPRDWFIEKLDVMHEQAVKIFGPFPRDRFEYQIVLDDHVRFGLEHFKSTFIGTKQRRIIDAKETDLKGGGGDLTVIPHEYIHVWVGKLREPLGLRTDHFHEERNTELLWVYEGLTTYYTDILAARAGLITREEYEHGLANDLVAYEQRAGRMWRPLADTARAAGMLRDRNSFWIDYRRAQDYYTEGSLFWMEADAIIRAEHSGRKSLDDFCLAFFDVPAKPIGDLSTYTREDVVNGLAALAPKTDWDAMIRERIEEPRDVLTFDTLLERVGIDLVYSNEPTELQKEDDNPTLRLRTSLGIDVDEKGNITRIIPMSPADEDGLSYGMRILAVDGFVFSQERLEDAIKATPETGDLELVVSFGDRIQTRTIEYDGGMRWPRLVHREDVTAHLPAIISPRK